MPKRTSSPMTAVSIAINKPILDYIDRVGKGENISQKLRFILEQYMLTADKIVGDDGRVLKDDATCIYQVTAEGERIWIDDAPFKIDKKKGWQAAIPAAQNSGYITQTVENKEEGTIQVWIAKNKARKDCEACKEKIMAVLNDLS